MSLPRMTAPETVTITPTETSIFPDAFMLEFRMNARPGQPWPIRATLQNFNFTDNVLGPDSSRRVFQVADVRAEAARCPMVGQAMGAVLVAVDLLVAERKHLADIAVLSKQITGIEQELESWNTELEVVNASLVEATEQLNLTETTLQIANSLPEEDETKADQVAAAQAAFDAATTAYDNILNRQQELGALINDANARKALAELAKIESETKLAEVHTHLGIVPPPAE